MMGLVLAALVASLPSPAVKIPVSKQAIEGFRAFLDDVLLDAPSARFKDVVVVEREGDFGGTVCGKINSKNSMGAYTGYRTFVGYLAGSANSPVALVLGVDDADSQSASAMCAKYGYE